MNTSTAPRIEWLDFVKGVAIICIVAGHSGNYGSLKNYVVFSFHVPIFFIISGFIFGNSNSIKLSFGEISYKRFRSLIAPYFTTGLIFFLLITVLYLFNWAWAFYTIHYNKLNVNITDVINILVPLVIGKQILLNFCYGTGKEVSQLKSVIGVVSALWFLPSMFCANIIFYFFLKLFEKYSIAIQSIIIIILTVIGYMIGKYIFLPWSIDVSLVAQIFIFSGYLMQKYKIFEKKAPIWVYIAAASIWLLDLYMGAISLNDREYHNLAVSTIGAIAASYLLMKLSCFQSSNPSFYYRSISYIGRQSIVILCFHAYDKNILGSRLMSYLGFVWLHENNYWIILTLFRLCYSLLFAEIIKRLPILRSAYYPWASKIKGQRSIQNDSGGNYKIKKKISP
jgi:fucose 4-O-acetylase-like acetyltransferase